VDPDLKAIHFATVQLYNREAAILKSTPTSVVSINATYFLAEQATTFADAALLLMEDARQPLNVPAALLRTCLEAQAKANHIIALTGNEREKRADEFRQLMEVGFDYYELLTIQWYKDIAADESKILRRDQPYLPQLKATLGKIDTSKLKTLKKQYDQLNGNWGYGRVVERDKFKHPIALGRSEAQPLQPGLNLIYIQCCAFVHSSPAVIHHKQVLSPVDVAYSAVLAEFLAVLCFFVALGKQSDKDLLHLKARIIAFDVNDRILPKKDLPLPRS
jgi:hypothetical protein